MLVNLKSYKTAKKFSEDYVHVARVFDLTIRALQPFSKYKPVVSVLDVLRDNKAILDAHKNTADKILKQAGGNSGKS